MHMYMHMFACMHTYVYMCIYVEGPSEQTGLEAWAAHPALPGIRDGLVEATEPWSGRPVCFFLQVIGRRGDGERLASLSVGQDVRLHSC